jgi:hypothetical protein
MFELSQVFTTALGALFGALFGGAVSWGNARRERRITLTLSLFGEFHSPAFNDLRIRAHEALSRSGKPLPLAYAEAHPTDKQAIYSIMHYFERVALLRRTGVLDDRLLKRFMHQYAKFWRPLLCGPEDLRIEDPEWGETLREIDRLFARIGR